MFWMVVNALGGIINGSFGLPMKFTTKWKWENTWSLWSLWTLLVVPWTIGFATVPNLLGAYADAGWGVLAVVFLLGIIWGVSAIAFGTGMDYLGLALGYSLMMGLIIVVGSLVPLVVQHPQNITEPNGLATIAGVLVILMGILLNAWAAVMKERDLTRVAAGYKPGRKKSFLKGLIVCLVAGCTAPMLNYAFIYGDQLKLAAMNLGATKTMAPNSIWTVALFGGFFVNVIYCTFLTWKNNSWGLYLEKGTGCYYFYTLLMGILWAGGIAVYGMATANLGQLGPSIGWAIFNAMAIFWANVLGVLTGEWKGVTNRTVRMMASGLFVLLCGVCVVGWANSLE